MQQQPRGLPKYTPAVTMYIPAHLPRLNEVDYRLGCLQVTWPRLDASTTAIKLLCTGSKQQCLLAAKALTLQPTSSAQGRLSSSDFNSLTLKMPRRGRGRLMGKDQRLQAEAETASQALCGFEYDTRLLQPVAGPKAASSRRERAPNSWQQGLQATPGKYSWTKARGGKQQ